MSTRWQKRCAYNISFLLIQLPSANTFVGISGLILCDGSGWKERIEVCMELLAAVNRTETPRAESVLQGNQCSFASLVFELKSLGTPPLPVETKGGFPKRHTCKPLNGTSY